jgi:tripartite-type tricarboxylate transporter receptor subunit TctC
MKRRYVLSIAAVAAVVAEPVSVLAQSYPSRPVRIVTSGVGGGSDLVARLIAIGLTDAFGHQVIVDNRPSGFTPAEIVARASPDGHTILLATGIMWLQPLLHEKISYDPVKDFAPVTIALNFPNLLAVNLNLPVKSVPDLIALAKIKTGGLNYGTTGAGSAGHLAAEMMKSMAGVNIVRIAYKSGAMMLTDLTSGQIQLSFLSAGSAIPHVKAGRVRALAVTSAKPTAIFPQLPTMAAFLPGYQVESIYGIFAPARTPRAIIDRLQLEVSRSVNRPDIKDKLLASVIEPVGSPPEALAELRASEMTRMGKLIRDTGMRGGE